jgi:hypothetical protein
MRREYSKDCLTLCKSILHQMLHNSVVTCFVIAVCRGIGKAVKPDDRVGVSDSMVRISTRPNESARLTALPPTADRRSPGGC